MTNILIFDTETNGIIDPVAIELCWQIYTKEGQYISSHGGLMKLKDIKIIPEAFALHGLTEEDLVAGHDPVELIEEFITASMEVSTVLSYNIGFDMKAIINTLNLVNKDSESISNLGDGRDIMLILSKKLSCVLQLARETIPRYKINSYKLNVVYKKLFNEEPVGIHRADMDTTICAKVYFGLLKLTK